MVEKQLKINYYNDIIVEWIPYDQFSNIKELEKDEFTTRCSATWKDGPLNYDIIKYEYTRIQNKKINLKCLHNSQNVNNEFLIEFKKYSTRFYSYNKFKIYGISQNPDIKDYILVLQNVYCDKCGKCFTDKYGIWCKSCQINDIASWTSGNEKIDNLVQEMR
ncbi:kinase-like domain-containing protein [Rhizophagus clarus]|uniref:Kinase-like domain-containing protein n=1 Tax=Rhizophagus clarus TaxID=94130 RepID=A0A8H3LWE9_9GLOM|nr:kinase-like domain-containing protein [Rhizophagus clarus]